MSREEEFGMMKATIDNNRDDIQEIKGLLKDHIKEQKQTNNEIRMALSNMRDELNIYKVVWSFVKLVGASALLVLTFKFGDVSSLWRNN